MTRALFLRTDSHIDAATIHRDTNLSMMIVGFLDRPSSSDLTAA